MVVLILVLMEYSLTSFLQLNHLPERRLNPCSNGILSDVL